MTFNVYIVGSTELLFDLAVTASTCVTDVRGLFISDCERVESVGNTGVKLSCESSPSSDAYMIYLASVHGRLDEGLLIGDDADEEEPFAPPVVFTYHCSKLPECGGVAKLRRERSIEGAEPEEELDLLTELD